MTSIIKTKVRGFKEIEQALKKLQGRQANNIVAAGLRASSRVIIKDARSRLPSNYEVLKKSLVFKTQRRKSFFELKGKIGPTTGKTAKFDAWYAGLVEFGTTPHVIAPKRSKILNIGDDKFSKRVAHPGVKARPFLRPAIDNTLPQVMNAYADKVWAGITKVLARTKKIK